MDSELHFHADLLSSSPLTSLPQAAQWQHSPLGPLPASLRAALLLSVFLCCLTSLPKGSFPLPFSPQLHAAQRAALSPVSLLYPPPLTLLFVFLIPPVCQCLSALTFCTLFSDPPAAKAAP
ncbi:hypothetical protein ACFX2G_007253 [Malus domestica]